MWNFEAALYPTRKHDRPHGLLAQVLHGYSSDPLTRATLLVGAFLFYELV